MPGCAGVGEGTEQTHHPLGVVGGRVGTFPFVDAGIDAGPHVVGPQLRPEARKAGEQWRVQDALPTKGGMEELVAAKEGEAELDHYYRGVIRGRLPPNRFAEYERRRAVLEMELDPDPSPGRGKATIGNQTPPRSHASREVTECREPPLSQCRPTIRRQRNGVNGN
jgi:hypothetical protein